MERSWNPLSSIRRIRVSDTIKPMKINIKATGMDLTPAIFDYTNKRMEKLGKYLETGDPVVAIELGKSTHHHKHGEVFRAEVRISGSGTNYYAVKEATDLYAAIDEVRDEVIQEITKSVGKKRELLRRGERAIKDMVRGFPWIKWKR